jgi:hypothetical protein
MPRSRTTTIARNTFSKACFAFLPLRATSGFYTVVRFECAQGSGTRIVFDHTGFAPEDREHLSEGWPRMYWDPLRKYLDS